jgi:hypothetical protein
MANSQEFVEIDDELELRGLLHRKIGQLTAFEDVAHIARDLAASLRKTRAVRGRLRQVARAIASNAPSSSSSPQIIAGWTSRRTIEPAC